MNNLKKFKNKNVQILDKIINLNYKKSPTPQINMEDQMNNNAINEQEVKRTVKVRASDIIKKFKSIHDRQSFCKENSKST